MTTNDAPAATDAPTPETDTAESRFMHTPARSHPYEQLLDFARRLERERDAARAELTATKWALESANAHNPLEEQLAEYKRMSESGESLGGELEEREQRIAVEKQLADARHQQHLHKVFAENQRREFEAEIARLREDAEALVDLVKAVRVLMCYPDLRRNIGTDCYDPVADALAALGKEWEE